MQLTTPVHRRRTVRQGRRGFGLALALVLIVGLAACGETTPTSSPTQPSDPATSEAGSETPTDAPTEVVEFVVPATAYNVNTGYFPIAVGIAKGLFEEHGVSPEPLATGGGGEAVRAFTSDSNALIGSVGLPSAVPAIDAGENFRIFGQLSDASDTWIAARAGEGIETPADLEGKKIGVTRPGSTTEQVAVAALESAGLSADDAEMVYLGGVPDLVVALQEGLVDAISGAGWLTRTQYVDVEEAWTLLGTGDEFTPIVDAVWVTKAEVAEQRPEIYEGFLAGRNAAVEYIAENPDDPELRDIMEDWLGITDDAQDQVEDVAVQRLSEQAREIYGDGAPNVETYTSVAEILVEQDVISEVPSDWSPYLVE